MDTAFSERIDTLKQQVGDIRDHHTQIGLVHTDWRGAVGDLEYYRLSRITDPELSQYDSDALMIDVASVLAYDLRRSLDALERSLQRYRLLKKGLLNAIGIRPDHLDRLVDLAGHVRHIGEVSGDDVEMAALWNEWYDKELKCLETLRGCLTEPDTGGAVVDAAIEMSQDLANLLFWVWSHRTDKEALEKKVASLEAEVGQLRHQLAHLPRKSALVVPPRTVKVKSAIKREVLRLMATRGLGRSWRIAQSVAPVGSWCEKSVKNTFTSLFDTDQLIDHYRRDGVPVFWKPAAGGNRNLWVLTDLGWSFCQEVLGVEPVESELLVVARRHSSVKHGVGILEARDHLLDKGYQVDDDPAAILENANARWDRRVEADLLLSMDSEVWPVEVQREVSERMLKKWEKALLLTQRLVIVLFNERKLQRQRDILNHWQELPRGSEIRLISLEAIEAGDWRWRTVGS